MGGLTCAGYGAVFVLFWAVALKAGIALANRALARWGRASRPSADPCVPPPVLPSPGWLHAAGIVLLTAVVNVPPAFVYTAVVADLPFATGLVLLAVPVPHVVAAAVLAAALPTTFRRAWLAVLFQYLAAGAVMGVLLLVVR